MTNTNFPNWWHKGAIVKLKGGKGNPGTKPVRVTHMFSSGMARLHYVNTGHEVSRLRHYSEVVPCGSQPVTSPRSQSPLMVCTTNEGNVYTLKNEKVRVGDTMKDTNERVVLLLSLENAVPYHGGFTRDI